MDYLAQKRTNKRRRANRVRSHPTGNGYRPRLSLFISNQHVSAQIVDDSQGKTLVYASTVGRGLDGTLTDKAGWVGREIAEKAKAAKLKKVMFDRGSRKYHGRVKALAEAARAGGLEF